MPRYIDADALKLPDEYQIDPFDEPYYRGIGNGWNVALKECRERIDSAPTISPDDVRGVGCHACQCKEPLPEDGMSHEYYIRGNTLYHYDTYFGWEGTKISYCPECGARLEVSEDA